MTKFLILSAPQTFSLYGENLMNSIPSHRGEGLGRALFKNKTFPTGCEKGFM
ncbi:MAG: hypothetical protein IJT97_07670 [Bacteroidaceae bacterium]|nr:hypothetical protein [Bacteroidaceae bacterium]